MQRLTFHQSISKRYRSLSSKQCTSLSGERTPASLWFIYFSSISGQRFSRQTGRLYLNRYKRHLAAFCKGPGLTAVARKSPRRLPASSAK